MKYENSADDILDKEPFSKFRKEIALSMLDTMQHANFTQILRRFHADFHAACVAES